MRYLTCSKVSALGLAMQLLVAGTTQADSAAPPQESISTPVQFSMSIGTEKMSGDTTYQIGFPLTTPSGVTVDGYFPFSELEWPLDIWLAKLDGSLLIKDTWRINATLKKNVTDPEENMADSDWLTPWNPNQLDVYSESEISGFDALIFDVDFEWIFVKRDTISFYAGLGLLYQDFDYEGKLLTQYSPSGLSGWDATGNGEVGITYDVTYTIPYLKFGTDFQATPHLAFAGSFAFSPIVEAEDTDRHLLRDKISTGDMDGNAFMVEFSGKYMFTPALFVEAGFQFVKIDVDGTQTQAFGNGVQIATVAEESESSQASGFLALGFQF